MPIRIGPSGGLIIAMLVAVAPCFGEPIRASEPVAGLPDELQSLVTKYCTDCHNRETHEADLALDERLRSNFSSGVETWEHVVRKLTTRQMPPVGSPRPTEIEYQQLTGWIAASLDRIAAANPNPGRTESFRRLTRTEYQNAIRDLLALDIDAATLLPPDESSQGFDNITVTDLSPTLVSRYLAAAEKISRLAVGHPGDSPGGETIRLRPDITQDNHVDGLPFGTRGGTLIPYTFPADGTYTIQVHLMRNRNDEVEGLREPHTLEFLLDRERIAKFQISPPQDDAGDQLVDAKLTARVNVTAGPHDVAITFRKQPTSLQETARQPLNVHFNFYRHPRQGPAVYEVSIIGPFDATGPGDTPSRERIFSTHPSTPAEEDAAAREILSNVIRRAYRRPVEGADLEAIIPFYEAGRAERGFEGGIERALAAVLVNPRFLFRIEAAPVDAQPQAAYRISDIELASRLSFFLWSSLPDEELLGLAESSRLSDPKTLDSQVRRMLADDRSLALVTNFAGQWLHLRNLDAVTPDMRLFPDFDHNLREAFRQETELFVGSVFREDRSVLDLIRADDTFLNERLARHYEIPHVYGSRFRRVELDGSSHRGGLLRHGSILAVTSYATRTSPVLRGKWVLENFLGTPPPPPPPNIPALEDNVVNASLPLRERLAAHRADEACAGCHALIDPVGFALENFDAVGRWRAMEEGKPVDVAGGLPGSDEFDGVAGLEAALLRRPELFVRTLTEKLLTHALGRGLGYYDAPAVRRIVADARGDDFRFSSLIVGIVQSVPFQMRSTE